MDPLLLLPYPSLQPPDTLDCFALSPSTVTMSSGLPQQQGVVDALVENILKRDILFVLYHLKALEPSRINQVGQSLGTFSRCSFSVDAA